MEFTEWGKEADLDKDCDEAIDQIIAEKYAEGLYGYEQILCYGVAFFQKQAKVKLVYGIMYDLQDVCELELPNIALPWTV